MEQIVKAYLGTFLILLLTAVGTGLVSAEMSICRARNFKTDVVTELENSNYNPNVASACIKQAEESGYQLQIKMYGDGKRVVICDTQRPCDVPEKTEMAEVIVTYAYEMGPFHTKESHSIRGYAR